MKNSNKFKDLMTRIKFLKENILPKLNIHGDYSLKEEDYIRSFILLVHAEIENFLEERVSEKAVTIYTNWKQNRKKSNSLKSMIIFSKTDFDNIKQKKFDKEKIEDRMEYILKEFNSIVYANHGIKKSNIISLLLPIGIERDDIDEAWLNTMDNFGSLRGTIAHKSHSHDLQIIKKIDPITVINELDNIIIPQLKIIDYMILRLA